jgi:hypothetical protein
MFLLLLPGALLAAAGLGLVRSIEIVRGSVRRHHYHR